MDSAHFLDWHTYTCDDVDAAIEYCATDHNRLVLKRIKAHIRRQELLLNHQDELIEVLRRHNLELTFPKRTRSGAKY